MTNMVEIMWRGIYQDVGELVFPVSMRGFIREVLKRSHTTYTTAQIAICYLFQTQQAIRNYMIKEPRSIKRDYISCGRRMFLASLIVASKYVQDKTYRNSAWASIARLPVHEVNLAERIFLELSDYQLYVSQNVFDDLHRLLRDYVADALAEPPVASLHQISFAWTPDLCRCVVLPQQQQHHLLMPTPPQMTYASSGAKRPRADTPDFNTAQQPNKRCKSQTPPCLLRPTRPHFVLGHAPCI
ncbi:hypothetical protein BJV82DRAFT_636484 [Fennellomyces sp. T-0311]|nr:hypothetical protein BJV82DRAFT_636484 [Fennellomyces sp. T-0311]